jgi:uncharacterized membrane protein YhaH (DUF805 family)
MIWFFRAMGKYAIFSGRARRKEYWYFTLYSFIFAVISGVVFRKVEPDLDPRYATYAYDVLFLVPALAVGVRRMHDIERSGWYIFIPIYSLVLCCENGTPGDNEYGPDPKAGDVIYGPDDYEKPFDINSSE